MPVFKRKDLKKVEATRKLRCDSQRRHYFQVYLWETLEDLREHTELWDAKACMLTAPCRWVIRPGSPDKYRPYKKLGELHFARGCWDEEIVAHELLHAAIQRMRAIKPSCCDVRRQEEPWAVRGLPDSAEELVCYEFGAWFQALYRWLWIVTGSWENL